LKPCAQIGMQRAFAQKTNSRLQRHCVATQFSCWKSYVVRFEKFPDLCKPLVGCSRRCRGADHGATIRNSQIASRIR
jgi:hypothetical protein